jgi:hypothetical protein
MPVTAQQHPADRLHPQWIDQHGRGRQRGVEGEGTDVADPPDQRRRGEGAEEEADEVPRHHQAGGPLAPTLCLAAHRQQRAQQSVAAQQQGDAGEQGGDGKQDAEHGAGSVP